MTRKQQEQRAARTLMRVRAHLREHPAKTWQELYEACGDEWATSRNFVHRMIQSGISLRAARAEIPPDIEYTTDLTHEIEDAVRFAGFRSIHKALLRRDPTMKRHVAFAIALCDSARQQVDEGAAMAWWRDYYEPRAERMKRQHVA